MRKPLFQSIFPQVFSCQIEQWKKNLKVFMVTKTSSFALKFISYGQRSFGIVRLTTSYINVNFYYRGLSEKVNKEWKL